MKCPTCGSFEFEEMDLVSEQFEEDLFECSECSTQWVKTHGSELVVSDSAEGSFIGHTDCEVDGSTDFVENLEL